MRVLYSELGAFPCSLSFYNNITKATESNGFLLFNDPIPSSGISKLFIRDCYSIIASGITKDYQNIAKAGGHYRGIVSGSFGMGKSLFMIYLLFKLLKQGKRVLFINRNESIYFDGNGKVYTFPRSEPSSNDIEFWKKDLWCLLNAKGKRKADLFKLPYDSCHCLLATQPRCEMVSLFENYHLERYYIPPWSREEISAIAPLFNNPSYWPDRFTILGGSPCYVLECSQDPFKLLHDACMECRLNETIGCESPVSEKIEIHLLVHISSNAPFKNYSRQFASKAALETVVHYRAQNLRIYGRLLVSPLSLTAIFCERVFRLFALELLEKGGVFKCHRLGLGYKETLVTIPPSQMIIVDGFKANQTKNQLHIPRENSCSAFDAWIPGIGVFQMAFGKEFIAKPGAKDELELLGTSNKLYWLVPPFFYQCFDKKTNFEIDQYSMVICYPSRKNYLW